MTSPMGLTSLTTPVATQFEIRVTTGGQNALCRIYSARADGSLHEQRAPPSSPRVRWRPRDEKRCWPTWDRVPRDSGGDTVRNPLDNRRSKCFVSDFTLREPTGACMSNTLLPRPLAFAGAVGRGRMLANGDECLQCNAIVLVLFDLARCQCQWVFRTTAY